MQLKDVLPEIKDTINENNDALGGRIKGVEDEVGGLKSQVQEMYVSGQRPGGSGFTGPAKSIGQQFVESDEHKSFLERKESSSAPFYIGSFHGERSKDLSSEQGSGGALIEPQRVPQIVAPPDRTFRMRDLFRVQSTQSNAVEYIEESGFVNNAAPVSEATSSAPEGALKPISELTFAQKSVPVRTIAHAVVATRQVLADASQLQGYINGRLIYGLRLVEEQQLLYGDGSGENLQGILTHPDRQQRSATDTAGDHIADAIRRAMTDVELAEFEASGVIMHPRVWERVELLKDANENYMRAVTIDQAGRAFLFGKPIVTTPAIMETDVVIGAFDLASDLWDREQSSIRVSEHHQDIFLRNQTVILGEQRLAHAIVRPQAYVHLDLTAPAE